MTDFRNGLRLLMMAAKMARKDKEKDLAAVSEALANVDAKHQRYASAFALEQLEQQGVTTDFRGLCQQLMDAIDSGIPSQQIKQSPLAVRVDAALAQPEPQGPTDEEARELANDLGITRGYFDHECGLHISCADLAPFAESVLARWGRPAIEPVPADELLAAYRAGAADAAIEPVPVSERLPEPGVKVLAHYLNSHGKSRTVCARWIPAKFESSDPETDDLLEYDEDSDAFYWPEGWYETIENWDDYGSIMVNEGEVTHWLPLPHWALPVPVEVEA